MKHYKWSLRTWNKISKEYACNTCYNSTPEILETLCARYFLYHQKAAVSSFQDPLNSIDPRIYFTIEHGNNCQTSFLDTLVSRDNSKLLFNDFRKTTH